MKTESYIRKVVDRVLTYLDELKIIDGFADEVAAKVNASSLYSKVEVRAPRAPRPPVDADELHASVLTIFKASPDRYVTASGLARALSVQFAEIKPVLDALVEEGTLAGTPGRRHGVRYWLKGRGRVGDRGSSQRTAALTTEILALLSKMPGGVADVIRVLAKKGVPSSDATLVVNRMIAQGVLIADKNQELVIAGKKTVKVK